MPVIPLIITLAGEVSALIAAVAKIKAIFSADGTNYIVQLQQLQAGAITTADETEALISKWSAEHPAVPKA